MRFNPFRRPPKDWQARPDWYELAPVGGVTTRSYSEGEQSDQVHDQLLAARHGWEAERMTVIVFRRVRKA